MSQLFYKWTWFLHPGVSQNLYCFDSYQGRGIKDLARCQIASCSRDKDYDIDSSSQWDRQREPGHPLLQTPDCLAAICSIGVSGRWGVPGSSICRIMRRNVAIMPKAGYLMMKGHKEFRNVQFPWRSHWISNEFLSGPQGTSPTDMFMYVYVTLRCVYAFGLAHVRGLLNPTGSNGNAAGFSCPISLLHLVAICQDEIAGNFLLKLLTMHQAERDSSYAFQPSGNAWLHLAYIWLCVCIIQQKLSQR